MLVCLLAPELICAFLITPHCCHRLPPLPPSSSSSSSSASPSSSSLGQTSGIVGQRYSQTGTFWGVLNVSLPIHAYTWSSMCGLNMWVWGASGEPVNYKEQNTTRARIHAEPSDAATNVLKSLRTTFAFLLLSTAFFTSLRRKPKLPLFHAWNKYDTFKGIAKTNKAQLMRGDDQYFCLRLCLAAEKGVDLFSLHGKHEQFLFSLYFQQDEQGWSKSVSQVKKSWVNFHSAFDRIQAA